MCQLPLRNDFRCRELNAAWPLPGWPVFLLAILLAGNAPLAPAALTTIWDANGQLAVVNSDAVPAAPGIAISRDGAPAAVGDQLAISYRVGETGPDYRQVLVIDSNGFMRLRHLDGHEPPGSEDPFGTSVKLPPGLITNAGGGPDVFYLSARLTDMNLITQQSSAGVLQLAMRGSPFGGAGQPAPVAVSWLLTLGRPDDHVTTAILDVTTTFAQSVTLSANRLASAEAFQSAMFSSSNTDPSSFLPAGTHDADRLLLTDASGRKLVSLDLTAAPRNQLLLGAGQPFDGIVELGQLAPAPLNGDPPNVAIAIRPAGDHPEHRAQGYLFATIDANDDNLGVWAARTFPSPDIAEGSRFTWTLSIVASEEPAVPRRPAATAWMAY